MGGDGGSVADYISLASFGALLLLHSSSVHDCKTGGSLIFHTSVQRGTHRFPLYALSVPVSKDLGHGSIRVDGFV